MSAQAAASGSSQRRSHWWLLPRFPEPIAPEFYRQSGKIRLIAILAMLLVNLGSTPQLEEFQLDRHVWWATFFLAIPFWGVDILLTALIWRWPMSTESMRRLTMVCMPLEVIGTLIWAQAMGSVTSHMIIFGLLGVMVYRLAFDFATGAIAFAFMVAGQWAIIIAETQGWLTPQPMVLGPLDPMYSITDRALGAMTMLTGMYIFTFVFANWAVARMRHKDQVIRILRESLYAVDGARVGQHTGRTLRGTYTVGALIGAGGMGEVYAGHHRRTRREVAIKLLHPHLIEDPLLLKRFRREAEITGRLGSQHIVEIIDIDEDENQPFLVLEYLQGKNLSVRVRSGGPLSPEETADLVAQLARGLAIAHDAGVVHRDLKPENIFLCPRDGDSDLLKILDFGVSKIQGAATAITHEVAIIGTPDYMSPEQAIGQLDEVDSRTDIFAVGGIVYFALAGRPPFSAPSVPALLRRICDEEPIELSRLRRDLPASVSDVLAIAMAKRPEERYASASELADDLCAALAGDAPPEIASRASALHRGQPSTASLLLPADDDSINPAAETQLADELPFDTDPTGTAVR